MELKCVCHDCLPAPFCLLFNFALFSFLHFCILDVEARAFCGMMCSEVDVARVQTDATLCHRRFAALFRINLSSKQLRSFVHHTWSWWLLFCTNTSTSCWMESAKLHSRFAFWQIVVLQPVCQCAIDMPRKSHTSAHEPTQDFTMDSGTTSKNDNNTQRLWINTIARAIINFEQCRWWFQSWYFIIYFYFYSVCVCVWVNGECIIMISHSIGLGTIEIKYLRYEKLVLFVIGEGTRCAVQSRFNSIGYSFFFFCFYCYDARDKPRITNSIDGWFWFGALLWHWIRCVHNEPPFLFMYVCFIICLLLAIGSSNSSQQQ